MIGKVFQDLIPQAYVPLPPRNVVCAAVRIVSISRKYHNCIDQNQNSFGSRIDLCKDQGSTYRICLISSNGGIPIFFDLSGLLKVEITERNTLKIEFENSFEGVFIEVHFKYREQFQYFDAILNEIREIVNLTNTGSKVPMEDRGKYTRRIISEYKVRKDNAKTLSGIPISSGSIDTFQFFEKNAGEWFLPELAQWVKHIYVQGRDMKKVVTLYDYMESIGVDIYIGLGNYFTGSDETIDDEEEEEEEEEEKKKKQRIIVTNDKTRNYLTLQNEIRKFESDPKTCNKHLRKVFQDKMIRQSLKKECEKLDTQGINQGYFDIDFHQVLTKRLNHFNLIEKPKKKKKKKSKKKDSEEKEPELSARNNSMTQLRLIIEDLNTAHRYWWSVEDCRDHILSLLLHKKSLLRFIKEKEIEFFRMEQKLRRDITEDDYSPTVTDDPYFKSQRSHVLVDPKEWLILLNNFNEKIGCRIQDISFRVKIAFEQNKLRQERKKFLKRGDASEGELKKYQDELNAVMASIETKRDRIRRYDDLFLNLAVSDEPSEELEKKMKGVQMMIDRIEKEVTKLVVQQKDIEKKIRGLTKKKSNEEEEGLKKLEEEIIFTRYENLRGGFIPFFRSEKRRKAISEYFTNQLDELFSKEEYGRSFRMSEISVKLVISILKGNKPDALRRKALSFLDNFHTPQFYQWGFIHTSVQLENVGCHWLSNALVTLTDLDIGRNYYEELIAIDCGCPLIFNKYTIYERLNELAELIVSMNINNEYHLFKTGDGRMNCQVFADRVTKRLHRAPFFPNVNLYLEELQSLLGNTDKHFESDNLRFLTVSDEFSKVYSDVWKSPKKGGKSKKKKKNLQNGRNRFTPDKKKRIYFNSHKDVDDFYFACERVLNDIDDASLLMESKMGQQFYNKKRKYLISHSEEYALDIKFPGEYQLLKGFDRAFWMSSSSSSSGKKRGGRGGGGSDDLGSGGDSLASQKFNPKKCPFINYHKHEREMKLEKIKLLKKTVRGDDDEEDDEEEEEEGESDEDDE